MNFNRLSQSWTVSISFGVLASCILVLYLAAKYSPLPQKPSSLEPIELFSELSESDLLPLTANGEEFHALAVLCLPVGSTHTHAAIQQGLHLQLAEKLSDYDVEMRTFRFQFGELVPEIIAIKSLFPGVFISKDPSVILILDSQNARAFSGFDFDELGSYLAKLKR